MTLIQGGGDGHDGNSSISGRRDTMQRCRCCYVAGLLYSINPNNMEQYVLITRTLSEPKMLLRCQRVELADRGAVPAFLMALPVSLLQRQRHRSRTVIAEHARPDARNRHDAAGGRGGEDLIGFLEQGARDRRHPCLDPHRGTELQNRFARDAMKTAAIGRQHLPILYEEDVEARPLGDE